MSTTVKTIKEMIEEMKEIEAKADVVEAELTEYKKQIHALRGKISAALEEDGLDSFETPDTKVFLKEVYSWKLPQGDEKVKFFEYLKANGQEDMLTVNSQTFNSFCRQQLEGALQNGQTSIDIPGVGDFTLFKQLNVRKRK